MEIFVKIMTENASRDEPCQIAAISFLTFVGLDEEGRPTQVPDVHPETQEERAVYDEATARKEARIKKRAETNDLIQTLAGIDG